MKFELDSLVNQNRIASSLPAQEIIFKKWLPNSLGIWFSGPLFDMPRH